MHTSINDMINGHSHGSQAASTYISFIPKCKKEVIRKSFFSSTIKSWNGFISHCREATSQANFSKLLESEFSINERLFLDNASRRAQVASLS